MLCEALIRIHERDIFVYTRSASVKQVVSRTLDMWTVVSSLSSVAHYTGIFDAVE